MRGSAAFRIGVAPGGVLAPAWVRDALWRSAGAVPSLDLRFANDKSLVDATTGANLVTFTRASSGTFVGSDGVLQRAVTNLIWPSEDFTTSWGLAAATRVADAGTAPNGTLTADRIESTGGGVFRSGISVASGVSCTYSVYIKHVSGTGVISTIGFERFGAVPLAGSTSFNVLTGTVVSNGAAVTASSITPVGDGWYRVSVRATSTDTTTTITNYAAASGNQFLLWGAQLEQSATVGEYIPTTSTINSAPRFDHNPTTGESLGLLVEEARTNSIRNNTMVGAAAGTPGTLPTNWTSAATTGIAINVVGTGTENGITYIDVQFVGTSTAASQTSLRFEGTATMSALASTAYTGSCYIRTAAGSLANISSVVQQLVARNSGGTNIGESIVDISSSLSTPNISRNRPTNTYTTPALTTAIQHDIRVGYNFDVAIDITLRIGLPQLEQGAFATSVIPTTTAAATRSADVASITGTNFSSWYRQDEGSVYWEGTRNRTTGFPERFSLNDGTVNNRIFSYFDAAANSSTFTVVTSSVNQGDIFGGGGALNSNLKTGFGFALNNVSAIYSGGVQNTDTTVTLPIVNQLVIGNGLGGTIRRLTYWPQRLSNTTLQQITA